MSILKSYVAGGVALSFVGATAFVGLRGAWHVTQQCAAEALGVELFTQSMVGTLLSTPELGVRVTASVTGRFISCTVRETHYTSFKPKGWEQVILVSLDAAILGGPIKYIGTEVIHQRVLGKDLTQINYLLEAFKGIVSQGGIALSINLFKENAPLHGNDVMKDVISKACPLTLAAVEGIIVQGKQTTDKTVLKGLGAGSILYASTQISFPIVRESIKRGVSSAEQFVIEKVYSKSVEVVGVVDGHDGTGGEGEL